MGSFNNKKSLNSQDVYGSGYQPRGDNNRPLNSGDLLKQYAGTAYSVIKRTVDKTTGTALRLYAPSRSRNSKALNWKAQKINHWQKKQLLIRSKAMVSSGDDITEILSNPALDLIAKKPNAFFSGWRSQYLAQLYLEITGITYYRLVLNGQGIPIEQYVLPPHAVKPILKKDGSVDYWEFGCSGNAERIQPEEMLVHKTLNLFNPYGCEGGTTGITATIDSLRLQDRITATLQSILQNEGRPSAILTPKGEFSDIDEIEAERIRAKYRQFIQSGSGGIMVADSEMTYTPLNYKPTDLAVIELSKYNEEQICRAYGMPLMVYTGTEGGSRAAMQTALQEWIDGAISFRLRENEDFLNNRFLPLFPDCEGFFFAYDDPSPHIEELSMQLATGLAGGPVISINEARSMYLGLDHIPEGDDIRGIDPEEEAEAEGETDSGTEPASDTTAVDPAVETEQTIQTSPALTLNGSQIESGLHIVSLCATNQLPRESGIGALRVLLNLTPEQAEQIMGDVGRTFFVQSEQPPQAPPEAPQQADEGKAANHVQEKAHKPRSGRTPPEGKELIPILKKHFEKWREVILRSVKSIDGMETKGLPKTFIPSASWDKELAKDCQPVIELIMEKEGHNLLTRVGASPDVFHVFNHKVKEKAEKAALKLSESTLETTTKDINEALSATRETMAEGLEEGATIGQLTKRIGEIFEGAETYRAERIARTESSIAWHEGLRESSKASGVVDGFTWETASECCDECAELDGKDIDLDGELPPLHPNCVCAVLERISDLPEEEANTEDSE